MPKPLRADLEHVPGEHREQAGRSAEQHGEQVEGDGSEHQLVPPQITRALPGSERPATGPPRSAAGCRRGSWMAQDAASGDRAGTDRVAEDRRYDAEQPAERRAEDAGKLGGQRIGRDRPRK